MQSEVLQPSSFSFFHTIPFLFILYFIALHYREWKFRGYPSSGIDILAVAESLCVNITLYGFYPYEKDPHGRPVLHHYYQPNLTNFHTRAHNFDREHKMLKDMHKRGLLRLVYDPCVTAAANVTGWVQNLVEVYTRTRTTIQRLLFKLNLSEYDRWFNYWRLGCRSMLSRSLWNARKEYKFRMII